MKKYFYFCNVKTYLRHIIECPKKENRNINGIKECGSGNTRKVQAVKFLTAPCTIVLTSKLI